MLMNRELEILFSEAIRMEANTAFLYELFRQAFPEDALFWGRLVVEEKNHSALLQTGKERFGPLDKFPRELLPGSVEGLIAANRELSELIHTCRTSPPTREAAFNIALGLETSAGEIHFQKFMEREKGSPLDEIFQRLNRNDKDHAKRLHQYMKENGIPIREKVAA